MSEVRPPSPFLALMEGRVLAEATQVLLMLPMLRLAAPRGNGEPLMVLPGFMADDRSTLLLREYLGSIGYRVYPWEQGANRRPMLELLPVLQAKLKQITADHGEKVRLVGWSRGGILSRELARDNPGLVDRVITMGSPVKGGVAASSISRWVQRETGMTPEQMKLILSQRSRTPIEVPVRAIYSKSDGVVAWKACIDNETEDIEHYEIESTHVGLGSNVAVFRLVPRLLNE